MQDIRNTATPISERSPRIRAKYSHYTHHAMHLHDVLSDVSLVSTFHEEV